MLQYVHPGVPFVESMPAGFAISSFLIIHGMVNNDAQRFEVNLHCNKGKALHFSPSFPLGKVTRNSFLDGNWGTEESNGPMPFQRGMPFVMKIVAQPTKFSITINGAEVFSYNYRYYDLTRIDTVEVKGDLRLTKVQMHLVATGAEIPTARAVPVADAGELTKMAGRLATKVEKLTQKAAELVKLAAELAQRQCSDNSSTPSVNV